MQIGSIPFAMKAMRAMIWKESGGPVRAPGSQVLPEVGSFLTGMDQADWPSGIETIAHGPRNIGCLLHESQARRQRAGWGSVESMRAYGRTGSKPRSRRKSPRTRSTGGELHGCNAPETVDEAYFGSFRAPWSTDRLYGRSHARFTPIDRFRIQKAHISGPLRRARPSFSFGWVG